MKYQTRVAGEEVRPDPEDSNGLGVEVVVVSFAIEKSELARLQAAYDPNSSTSPSVSDARPVLRALLDALLAE